jgi:hypothetical protein
MKLIKKIILIPKLARAEVAGAAPMTLVLLTVSAALQLGVPTVSTMLHLEVSMALATSSCLDLAARVKSSLKAAKIHHLEVCNMVLL